MWPNAPEEIPAGAAAVLTVPESGVWFPSPEFSEIAYAHDPGEKCRGQYFARRGEWFLIVVNRGDRRVGLPLSYNVELSCTGPLIPLVHYGQVVFGKRVFTTELDPLAETLYEKFGT